MFAIRTRTEPGWTALVPQGDSLLAAHVAPGPTGGLPRVAWTWEGAWSEDVERQADTLSALRAAHGAATQRVWLLSRGQYQVVPTEAPSELPEAEWAAALRWQLKGQLEFAAEDAAIDLLRIPQEAGSRRQAQLLAVLAPRNRLRPLVASAEAAKLPVQAIDIAETALRNWAGRAEPPQRAVALLSFGAGQGSLVITHEGHLLSFRQIELAADLLVAEDADRRQAALDRATLEVQRTLDHFDRLFSHLSLGRLLVAPGPGAPELIAQLSTQVASPVEALPAASLVDLSAMPDSSGAALGRWLLPIGAALRGA